MLENSKNLLKQFFLTIKKIQTNNDLFFFVNFIEFSLILSFLLLFSYFNKKLTIIKTLKIF